jgi:hypothetical protein
MYLVTIALAGFGSVFLLGFQSRNVAHGNFAWAAATSFMIALVQGNLWVLITRPETGWIGLVVYGASGAVGIMASMKLHMFINRKPQ